MGPSEKSGEQYFDECLKLVDRCDELDYRHVRIVEHYFHRYGGYSPNPFVFLAAASQRTKKARVITGANLPVFNNPLKLAGEIGMIDAISGGRAEGGSYIRFVKNVDITSVEGRQQILALIDIFNRQAIRVVIDPEAEEDSDVAKFFEDLRDQPCLHFA